MKPAACHLLSAAAFAIVTLPIGCSVSSNGLGGDADGAAGAGGNAACPAGLTHQASWPASSSTVTTCSRPCGPDDIGVQTCKQTDLASCRKESGCVCLTEPCVACADCVFLTLPECYVPSNVSSPPACVGEVSKGAACSPPCGKLLCLRTDGKTGCVCSAKGKYACGDWGDSGWK